MLQLKENKLVLQPDRSENLNGDVNDTYLLPDTSQSPNDQVPSSAPGAFYIGNNDSGEVRAENQDSTLSPSESSEHDDSLFPTQPNEIQHEMGSELVIDGVIVGPNIVKDVRKEFLDFVFVIIFTITFTVFLNLLGSPYPSIQPSLSPTCSLFTTDTYVDDIRDILINISGEAVLHNRSSIQYEVFKSLIHEVTLLERESILNANETKALIQRYALGVVGISASRGYQSSSVSEKYPATCELPFLVCNDNKEIVMLFMYNEWMTNRGGGILATEIGELKALTHLILSRSALHGPIPTELGKLKHLQYLDLHDNEFTGSIPTEIGQLHDMEMMFMQSNNLINNIPSELGNNLSRFFYIDLSQNMLDGSVPMELDGLNDLKGLKLHDNSLTGSVDFLCNKNMTTSSYDIEVHRVGGVIQETLDLGLSIDCLGELKRPECSCCSCG